MSVNIPENRLLLRPPEAAEVLAVSPRTLWTLTDEGTIPSIRVGRRSIRYSVDDLRTWIAKQKGELDA